MEVLTSPSTYTAHPEDAWQRLKGRVRKVRELAILIELAAWREREAQSRDVPRSRVLKDDALMDIVTAAPRTAEALGHLRSFPQVSSGPARERKSWRPSSAAWNVTTRPSPLSNVVTGGLSTRPLSICSKCC